MNTDLEDDNVKEYSVCSLAFKAAASSVDAGINPREE